MKSTKLRRNNLVFVDNPKYRLSDKGKIFKVIRIEENGCSLEELNDKYNSFGQFDKFIKPIPLDESWLLKFGFLCEINNKDSGYQQYTLLKTLDGSSSFNISFCIECNLNPECYLDNVGIEIIYVHQLQNLYFALTQKELEIK